MVPGEPLIRWTWITDNLDTIAERATQHLQLTALAVTVGFAISFALALLAVRWRRAYAPITAAAGVLYTIPSIALFAALVPFTGIGVLTPLIPLVLYTLLILVRNIVAGLDGVPPEIREAAEAMGYGRWRRLWAVELPLAVPLIAAGLRIATVSTIGLVTIAALVGQGGLGALIQEGLRSFFATKIYVGAVLSVALALAADVAFVLLQRRATPWARAGGR